MARIEYCKNFDCKNKYWCKKYVTSTYEEYENVPNLKDGCNEGNKYALYKSWKSVKE